MADFCAFLPADIPNVAVRSQIDGYATERAKTYANKSGVSRLRQSMRHLANAMETAGITFESMPQDFLATTVVPRLPQSPIGLNVMVRDYHRLWKHLQDQGVAVAQVEFPKVDLSKQRDAAAARAKVERGAKRAAAQKARERAKVVQPVRVITRAPPEALQEPAGAAIDPADVSEDPEDPSEPLEGSEDVPMTTSHAAPTPQSTLAASIPPASRLPTPTAPRRSAPTPLSSLSPSGARVRVWRLNGPGEDPTYIDEHPVEQVFQHGGSIEPFIGVAVRPYHGPFPGESEMTYRVEEIDVNRRVVRHWDVRMAAPKIPPPIGAPGHPAAPGTVLGNTPNGPIVIGQQSNATEAFAVASSLLDRMQEQLRGGSPQDAALRDDVKELQSVVRTLMTTQRHEAPIGQPAQTFMPQQSSNSNDALADIAKTVINGQLQQQRQQPMEPPPDPADKAMKMMTSMMAMFQPLMAMATGATKERDNDRINQMADTVSDLIDTVKTLARERERNPVKELAGFVKDLREIAPGIEGMGLFAAPEKHSWLESLKPVAEAIGPHMPGIIQALRQASAAENQRSGAMMRGLPQTTLGPPQPVAMRAMPPIPPPPTFTPPIPSAKVIPPAPPMTEPTAPTPSEPEAPVQAAAPSEPQKTELPPELKIVLDTPKPMTEAEALTRRMASPKALREAIGDLLETAAGADGDKIADGLATMFGEFWKAKDAEDGASKKGPDGKPLKPSKIGEILDAVDDLVAATYEADKDEAIAKYRGMLIESMSNIFGHLGWVREAEGKVPKIVDVLLRMREAADEEGEDEEPAAPVPNGEDHPAELATTQEVQP